MRKPDDWISGSIREKSARQPLRLCCSVAARRAARGAIGGTLEPDLRAARRYGDVRAGEHVGDIALRGVGEPGCEKEQINWCARGWGDAGG